MRGQRLFVGAAYVRRFVVRPGRLKIIVYTVLAAAEAEQQTYTKQGKKHGGAHQLFLRYFAAI